MQFVHQVVDEQVVPELSAQLQQYVAPWPRLERGDLGRGNPTTAALARLAEALGVRLSVTLLPGDQTQQEAPPSPEIPASLVRLGRTTRFQQAIRSMAATLALDADQLSVQLVAALALLASTMGTDSPRRTGGAFSTHSS